MTVNAGPEYFSAENRFFNAKTIDEKIFCLEEMIKLAPKHKSSETFVANLKQRLAKFEEKKEKASKSGKSSKKGIKKEGFQCVIIGLPNSGKSSLLSVLTNARPLISENPFSTRVPVLGSMNYKGIKAQIVEVPAIGSEYFDIGIIHTADLIIEMITSISDIEKLSPSISRAIGKKIIVYNKSDLLSQEQLRKLTETIKSKKLNTLLISCHTLENIEQLKELIFQSMDSIRVYTKEPGKPRTEDPIVLPIGSSVKDVAEKILKGFSKKVKETRVTGPSSKFPNQKVGIAHILKDLDIVEFHTN